MVENDNKNEIKLKNDTSLLNKYYCVICNKNYKERTGFLNTKNVIIIMKKNVKRLLMKNKKIIF